VDIKKNHPNSERRGFTYKRLTCEEFLICKTYWGNT
jgi:hypothetical protein